MTEKTVKQKIAELDEMFEGIFSKITDKKSAATDNYMVFVEYIIIDDLYRLKLIKRPIDNIKDFDGCTVNDCISKAHDYFIKKGLEL